jgi:hypothetical protein
MFVHNHQSPKCHHHRQWVEQMPHNLQEAFGEADSK